VVQQRYSARQLDMRWYGKGEFNVSLKSWLASFVDPSGSQTNTSAAVTPIFMPRAYTVAMVVLCKQPSNPRFNRSAQKLRFWVPVALRAPAPG
jgi:hypothetical protein